MKIIIYSLSGIGNLLMFTPTLKTLRKDLPNAEIHLLVRKKVYGEPIRSSNLIDKLIIFDEKNIFKKLNLLFKLRKQKYDISITSFPSNKIQFNLFSFLVGAKKRVTHDYKFEKIRTLSFLQNYKIKSDKNLHDIDQNLNLLKAFNLNPQIKNKNLFFHLNKENIQFADNFFKKNKIKKAIGIHPGSSEDYSFSYKRWPEEKFIELCNRIVNKYNVKILVFGGPEEKNLKEFIHKHIKNSIVINTNLKDTAALIKKCKLFITNDTGLMHIAEAVDTKIIAIFGPTNYTRTKPYSKKHIVIKKDLECMPCLKYPFEKSSAKIGCKEKYCMRKITIEDIFSKISKSI